MLMKKLVQMLFGNLYQNSRSNKTRQNIIYEKPFYQNRHLGKDFLILGTGSTLVSYGDAIKSFVKEKELITIGVNNIVPFIVPDYHGFVNRHRFAQFGNTINKAGSSGLLSINLPDSLIKQHCSAPYELVMLKDSNDPGITSLTDEGIIHHHGSVATYMIMVAYVMGARSIYVAGVDGLKSFDKGGKDESKVHYQDMPYRINKKSNLDGAGREKKYRRVEGINTRALTSIAKWAKGSNRTPFVLITPGSYNKYYDPSFLKGFLNEKIGK